jgi:hypothetical protein
VPVARKTVVAVVAVLAALGVTTVGFATSAAARPAPRPTSNTITGNDVSWPQCGKPLPTGQAFGIVGVNNGLANNTNPCLASQLGWAAKSTGATAQPKSAVYVNTGNPSGVAGIAWWPTSNTFAHNATDHTDTNDTTGAVTDVVTVPVPAAYGACSTDAAADAACSYVYGYAKAYDDVHYRGVPSPSAFRWWLDVETTNSWETTTRPNVADLEGVVDAFTSQGVTVGIYSTPYQWGVITGTNVTSTSPLAGLPNWTAGAASLKDAPNHCATGAFTPNSTVSIVQYVSKNLDYDYSCR